MIKHLRSWRQLGSFFFDCGHSRRARFEEIAQEDESPGTKGGSRIDMDNQGHVGHDFNMGSHNNTSHDHRVDNHIDKSVVTNTYNYHHAIQEQSGSQFQSASPSDKEWKQQVNIARDLLKPVDSIKDDYERLRRHWLEDTAGWILEENRFKQWVGAAATDKVFSRVLWVEGGPGAGKTLLSGFVARTLEGGFQEKSTTAYYFLQELDQEDRKRSLRSALLTMAFTIAENDNVYLTYLTSTIHTISPNISSATLYRIWQSLFVDYYSPAQRRKNATFSNEPASEMPSTAYLIIDGLDEALPKERMEFFGVIHEADERKLRLRIMLISRPEIKVELLNYSKSKEIPTISFSAPKSHPDIEKYVTYKVDRMRFRSPGLVALKRDVVKRLVHGAQGMFLWVDLMIKELQQKRNTTQIREALVNLPKGLPAMYTQILTRLQNTLSEEEMCDVYKLLTWVLFAKVPLSYRQLKHAFEEHSGQRLISFEGTMQSCSSLITPAGWMEMTGISDGRLSLNDSNPSRQQNSRDGQEQEPYQGVVFKIRHLSFAEYLKTSEAAIYSSRLEGEVCIVEMLLKALVRHFPSRDNYEYHDTSHRHEACSFLHYARKNLLGQLNQLDLQQCPAEKRDGVADALYALHNESEPAARWARYVIEAGWMDASTRAVAYVEPVARLLRALDSESTAAGDTKAWALAVMGRPERILESLVLHFGRVWGLAERPIGWHIAPPSWMWHAWRDMQVFDGAKLLHFARVTGAVPGIRQRSFPLPAVARARLATDTEKELQHLARWISGGAGKVGAADPIQLRIAMLLDRQFGLGHAALRILGRFISACPERGSAIHAAALACRACTLHDLGRRAEACRDAARAMEFAAAAGLAEPRLALCLARASAETGDMDTAIDNFRAAYEAGLADGLLYAILALYDAGRLAELVDLLCTRGPAGVRLLAQPCRGPGAFLARTTRLPRVLAHAARQLDQLPRVIRVISGAMNVARRRGQPAVEAWCHYLMGQIYASDPGTSLDMAICEMELLFGHLRDPATSVNIDGDAQEHGAEDEYEHILNRGLNVLIILYYNKWMEHAPDGMARYIDRVGELCDTIIDIQRRSDATLSTPFKSLSTRALHPSKCILGRCYRNLGDAERCTAVLRRGIGGAVAEYSCVHGEFGGNVVCTCLPRALMAAGDEENAITAFQAPLLIHSYPDDQGMVMSSDEKAEESMSSDEEAEEAKSSDEHLNWSDTADLADDGEEVAHNASSEKYSFSSVGRRWCDNHLNCRVALRHSLMVCKVCPDVFYCKPCVKLIEEGKFPIRLCPPEHGFLEIPGPGWWPPRVGYVIYRGQEVKLETWLQILRVKYGL
ncbi:hypothetical protein DFH27DRAFT_604473 [Peziza echinospora]|nr:hypothetical protein DFH27DRAFT_604473 [Peziza echinospora]